MLTVRYFIFFHCVVVDFVSVWFWDSSAVVRVCSPKWQEVLLLCADIFVYIFIPH